MFLAFHMLIPFKLTLQPGSTLKFLHPSPVKSLKLFERFSHKNVVMVVSFFLFCLFPAILCLWAFFFFSVLVFKKQNLDSMFQSFLKAIYATTVCVNNI